MAWEGKISRRILPFLVAGTLVFVGGSIAQRISTLPSDTNFENEVGRENFMPGFIPNDQFVVLDVGNYEHDGVLFQQQKIDYCNEYDVACGLRVGIHTDSLGSLYKDVDYIKGIVENNHISYPIYLDVNQLLDNPDLDLDTIIKYSNAFIEKCNSNGLYIGLYGTDSNLCRFKEYTGIDSLDAFLIQDSEEIQYDGTYNVVKDLDGNIRSSVDLENAISVNGNNTESAFYHDYAYTVLEGEELRDICFRYGLSVSDVLEFNDIKEEDVKEGTVLRIPSEIGKRVGVNQLEEAIRGADLSYAQGSNINWDSMKDNFSFLILKCNEGLSLDECFSNNIENCNLYEIPVGIYTYNAYDKVNTTSLDEFKEKELAQVRFALDSIEGKDVSYPLYLDVEMASGEEFSKHFDSEYVSTMLNIWMEEVSKAGHTPGLYCNQSGLDYLQSMVNYPLEERFELWVAGGDQYTSTKEDIPLEEVVPSAILEADKGISMAQSTDSAVNSGAGNGRGHLDINFSMKDYTISDDGFPIMEFSHLPVREVGLGVSATALLVGSSIIGFKARNKVKKK